MRNHLLTLLAATAFSPFGPEGQPEISRGRKPPVQAPMSHAPAGAEEIF
jgi:hypothetical protein